MALRKKHLKKNETRPKKAGAPKRRRQLEQKRRLVALGLEKTVVDRMNALDVRTALKRPLRTAKAAAKATAKG